MDLWVRKKAGTISPLKINEQEDDEGNPNPNFYCILGDQLS
jgi:hypothetical protein